MKRLVRPKVVPPKIERPSETINQYPTYQDYLLSPRWPELRKQAIYRDGGRCRLCNSSDNLEVHHRRYPKVWGEETVDDLTTLCSDCHDFFSAKKTFNVDEKPPLKSIPIDQKMWGAFNSKANRILWVKRVKSKKGRCMKIRDTAKLICKFQNMTFPLNWDTGELVGILVDFCKKWEGI